MSHLTVRLWSLSGALVLLFTSIVSPLSAQDRGARWFPRQATVDTSTVGPFDTGRIWGVADPPVNYFDTTYGIEVDERWMEHLRQGALRLPGCSAALVSEQGLALTTARCIRKHLEKTETERIQGGVFPEERPVTGLHADRLIETRDVTEEVRARAGTTTVQPAHLHSVQRQIRDQREDGVRIEVVAEAGGAQYTAYLYRRYTDLRLVFLPEEELSAFGGIEEVLTFPRHALDIAIFRVYRDDTPLTASRHFEIDPQDIRPGDPVFAIGHPATSDRSKTHDQITFRRDVVLPHQRSQVSSWVKVMQTHLDTVSSTTPALEQRLQEAQRTQKTLQLQLEAMRKDPVLARLQRRDEDLQRTIQDEEELQRAYGGLFDSLSTVQQKKRQASNAYRAFGAIQESPYTSSTLRRAILALQIRNTTGSLRDSLIQRLEAIRPQPPSVDAELLATHLESLRSHFEGDSVVVQDLLEGTPPAERATSIVESSILSRPQEVRRRLQSGSLPTEDPALTLVEAFHSAYVAFKDTWEELSQQEERLTRRLTRARHEVQESPLLSPADRAPRISDGRIRGFPYNGTVAPPYTTFYGMYAQHHAFSGEEQWELPERWTSTETLERSIPLNLVSSTDRAGGMPGAPLLNQYLQVVGLTFDGNVQSAAGEYLFLPSAMRTVSVDLRGLREVLTSIYDADALVEELFGYLSSRRENGPSSR